MIQVPIEAQINAVQTAIDMADEAIMRGNAAYHSRHVEEWNRTLLPRVQALRAAVETLRALGETPGPVQLDDIGGGEPE